MGKRQFGIGIPAGSTARITRSTNLPSQTSFTMCAWVRRTALGTGTNRAFMNLDLTAGTTQSTLRIRADDTFNLISNDPTALYPFPRVPVLGQWCFLAMTGSSLAVGGLVGHMWQNGVWDTVSNTDVAGISAYTPTDMDFGNNNGSGASPSAAEFAHMRVWKRALSKTELMAEMWSYDPVSTLLLDTSIYGWGDRLNQANGGQYTYTSVVSGTVASPLEDREVWMPSSIPVIVVPPFGPSDTLMPQVSM